MLLAEKRRAILYCRGIEVAIHACSYGNSFEVIYVLCITAPKRYNTACFMHDTFQFALQAVRKYLQDCGHIGPGGLHHQDLPMLGLTTPEK